MKDYVAEFKQKIAEIDNDCKNINIINAGIMDHGKSSLFNSLLDKDFFKVQDIRTTVEIGSVNWRDNVYLIDTPGLEAENLDDKVAYDAYRRANMIIFVHNVKVGELHDKELAAIKKIKSFFNDDDFFCKHFCLTLTFKEAEEEKNIVSILDKTLKDIENHCGISNFQVFVVSNSRYQKGTAENKKKLISESGIPELREYLTKNFSTWNNENAYFRSMRISNVKDEFESQLRQERGKIQTRINSKTEDIQRRQQNFLYKLETAVNDRRSDEQSINSAQSQLRNLKSDLQNTRDRWNRERY